MTTTQPGTNRLTTDPSILNSEAEPERPPLSTRVLAKRVDEVPRSGIRRFFDIMATMTDVISLGVGEPDFDTPEQVIEAGRHSLAARRTHYASNYGTIELRRALAHHLERLYGVRYDPTEEILITIGASEALDVACRATLDPGDEVIVHEPSYVSYRPCIIFAGGVPVGVNTTIDDGLRPRSGQGRGGHHAPDQGDAPQLPLQPDRRRAAARRPGRDRPHRRPPRPAGLLRRDLRPARLRRLRDADDVVAAGHAPPHRADGRLLQGVCHDGLADRLHLRSRRRSSRASSRSTST